MNNSACLCRHVRRIARAYELGFFVEVRRYSGFIYRACGLNLELRETTEKELDMKNVHIICLAMAALFMASTGHAKIAKNERDLIIVTHLDLSKDAKAWNVVYGFVEKSGVSQAKLHLKKKYRELHIIQTKRRDKNKKATVKKIVNLINRVTQRKGTKAVDMIWMTHGHKKGKISLQSAKKKKNVKLSVKAKLAKKVKKLLKPAQIAKLRMLQSTACYGASAINGWLEMGFKVASGSKKIYADSPSTQKVFLKSWKKGKAYGKSIKAMNDARGRKKWDNVASKMDKFKGAVDSTRKVRGSKCLTINCSPSKKCK